MFLSLRPQKLKSDSPWCGGEWSGGAERQPGRTGDRYSVGACVKRVGKEGGGGGEKFREKTRFLCRF